MRRKLGILMLSAVASGITVQGCGEMEGTGDLETVRSALGSFGSTWKALPTSGTFLQTGEALALARGTGTTPLVAFGRNLTGQIVATAQDSLGNWSGTWATLSNSGGPFTSGPSAVLFDVPSGSPLVGLYAIVARRDNTFVITIRDKNGGNIKQDWAAIPGGTFSQSFSAPAITFIPPGSSVGPTATLILTGTGDDGVVWEARNHLGTGNVYFHEAWTGFAQLPGGNPPNQTLVGSPSIAYSCQTLFGSHTSVVLGVMGADSNGVRTFFARKFDGTSWNGWTQLSNGSFHDGPAIAGRTACSIIPEIALFGLGEDDQIWVSTQLSGGSTGFTPLPAAPGPAFKFAGPPSAVGTSTSANVGAVEPGGVAFSNKASSP